MRAGSLIETPASPVDARRLTLDLTPNAAGQDVDDEGYIRRQPRVDGAD
jgi:hypothetical protein